MTAFPVPLDNLIAYVKGLHPDGGPLENVSDAFTVSTELDEQADALIGYFVDQARRSGLSWSQIGGAMGVSKQAAQKRFVPSATKLSDMLPESGPPASQFSVQTSSRFTARAARTLSAASKLAAPGPAGSAHLAAALLAEPEGFAAKAIAVAIAAPEQLYATLGTGPAERAENVGPVELLDLSLDESAMEAIMAALKAALRLGHNYIGTEHMLLGLLAAGGPVAEAFAGLGLTSDRAERLIADELAAYEAFRTHKPTG